MNTEPEFVSRYAFSTCIDLVVRHGNLNGNDLLNLALVSKDVKIDWKEQSIIFKERENSKNTQQGEYLEETKAKKGICKECHATTEWLDVFAEGYKCPSCRKYIGTTNAIKNYKLKAEDLLPLSSVSTYIYKAKAHYYLYNKKEVIGIALLKHGGPHGLKLAITPKKSIASQERQRKIKELGLTTEEYAILSKYSLGQYLKNGSKGIRVVKTELLKYQAFTRENLEAKHVPIVKARFAEYLNGTMTIADIIEETEDKERAKSRMQMLLNNYNFTTEDKHILIRNAVNTPYKREEDFQRAIDVANNRYIRKRELENALKSHGLRLRPDSSLCNGYINHGSGDLDDIVTTMVEMAWLFNRTNYKNIMGKRMKNAWEEYRRNRGYYDYWDEYDEDEDEVDYEAEENIEQPDKSAISQESKIVAVRQWLESRKHDREDVPPRLLALLP